jgi:uncharacterized protein
MEKGMTLLSSNRRTIQNTIFITLFMGLIVAAVVAASAAETKTSNIAPDSVNSIENSQTVTSNKSENNQGDKDKTTPDTGGADTKSTTIENEDHPAKHLFMWKATRGNQIVYLLGTIHAVRSGFYPVSDEIDKAFAQSKELLVECIPDRDKIIKVSKSISDKCAYQNGDNLYKHLSAGTKRVFEEYLAWAGEPKEIYETYRPFEVSGLISSDSVRRYGLTVPGLDRYLIGKAKQANKKIVELESVEFQLNLLSGLSEAEQDAELLSSLLTLQDVAVNLDKIIFAWRQGDPDDLEQLITKAPRSDSELKAVYDKIIIARNQGMIRKLEYCLQNDKDGTYLVAVGAGHMVGNYGLPALLKEKGFSVSQVLAPKEAPKISLGSSKLERLYYPEGKFSILLPGPPSVQYGELGGLRLVNYVYPTFAGSYSVGYLIMPQAIADPAKLNAFYNLVGMGMIESLTAKLSKIPAAAKTASAKTQKINSARQIKVGSSVQNSLILCNHPGRQIQMELTDTHGDKCLIRVRMVVVDRFLYILTVAGKKVWVDAPIVTEVLNSLDVRSGVALTKKTQTPAPNRWRR